MPVSAANVKNHQNHLNLNAFKMKYPHGRSHILSVVPGNAAGQLWRAAVVVMAGACSLAIAPAQAAAEWVSIKTLPGFSDAHAQLQALVNENGHHALNHMCVIGQKDGAHFQAEVYWPTENKLILWVPNTNDPDTLAHSRRYLDLTRDVRTNVGTSTYLLSRAFVSELLKACSTKGDQFVIRRASKPVPSNG